jgi:hypothetical protein
MLHGAGGRRGQDYGNIVCYKTMEVDKLPALPAGAVTVIYNHSQQKK